MPPDVGTENNPFAPRENRTGRICSDESPPYSSPALVYRPYASGWNQGWSGGTGIVLGFRVPEREQVDRLHGELTAAGFASQQTPYDAFWGSGSPSWQTPTAIRPRSWIHLILLVVGRHLPRLWNVRRTHTNSLWLTMPSSSGVSEPSPVILCLATAGS